MPETPETTPTPVVPPPPPLSSDAVEASIGAGEQLPPEYAKRWNWGAFLLAPFWSAAMRLWWPFGIFLGIIALTFLLESVGSERTRMLRPLSIAFTYWLARNANQLAWKSSRQWESFAQFKRTQDVWKWWGFGLLIAVIAIVVLTTALDTEW